LLRRVHLERENVTLKEMIQPKPQVPRQPKVELEGSRIYTPKPARSFVMPSDAELHRLLEIVLKHSPTKPPPDEEGNFFRGFKQAFMGLGEIGRQPEINQTYDIVHWMERAREVCRGFGIYPDFEFRAFCAAVLAHGDILFQDRDERLGLVPAFGLANYGGTPAGTAWRSVLEHGAPRSSTRTHRQIFPLPEVSIHRVQAEKTP
jgi:hypothetical protein